MKKRAEFNPKNFICKIVLPLLFVTLAVSGCDHVHPQETTIQFSTWGSQSELEILKPILENFEKENPTVHVELMHIPQNYFQKIHLLFASNTPPDVIFMNNLYLPVYANAGVLEEIEPFEKNQYPPTLLQSLSQNGKLYAIPRDVSTMVIFYNKTLFDKKSVPYPKQDWTFDDFLQTAKQLNGNGVWGISFEEAPIFYLPYLMSEGGGILSDDLSKEIIETENSQKGLKFYADLRKKYHVAPQKEEIASATSAQMFLQQKIAMHLSGRWLVPKYREEARFDWDIVPFPKGSAGSVVPLDSSGWAIAKQSKHKEEAKLLIKYLASKESSEQLTASGLIVPARIDVANSTKFLDGKKPKNAQVFLDAIKTAKPTPISVNYREITDKLGKQLEKLFN